MVLLLDHCVNFLEGPNEMTFIQAKQYQIQSFYNPQ